MITFQERVSIWLVLPHTIRPTSTSGFVFFHTKIIANIVHGLDMLAQTKALVAFDLDKYRPEVGLLSNMVLESVPSLVDLNRSLLLIEAQRNEKRKTDEKLK